ncbi:MAG: YjbQ family protein [Candidatus Micrarchaeota archaeon]|nr:YjbQ family protein [Candidatus Micrarchaeota archaeon]
MKVKTKELHFTKTENGIQVTDISRQVDHSVIDSRIKDGIVIVHVTSPWLSISTMDYEEGNIHDMKSAITKIAKGSSGSSIYGHSLGGFGTAVSYIDHKGKHLGLPKADGEGNVMHAILGPSITIPIKGNRTMLGKWQQILLWDAGRKLNEQARVIVQIIGDFYEDAE